MKTINEIDFRDLDQEVSELIQLEFKENEKPLLIAALGEKLSKEQRELIKDNYQTFTNYLTSRFTGIFKIVRQRKKGIAVAPIEYELDAEPDNSSLTSPFTPTPSYYNAIWRAFRTPIAAHKKRVVNINVHPPRVEDVDDSTDLNENNFEITNEDLSALGLDGNHSKPLDIHNAITKWCDGKFSRSLLERSKNFIPKNINNNFNSIIDLERIFSTMNNDELSRILIPADILKNVLIRIN